MSTKRKDETSEPSETVIPLDNYKQVTVRRFKTMNLVDIREFYVDKVTKEKKPGKKGISLTEEMWKKLMASQHQIQEALDQLNSEPPAKKVKQESISKKTVNDSEED
ncbi:hypothetical protein PSN45_003754 [Yamadazyma tenuis]|uniref:SsDNA-binding transcriptional regulator n=1 Tax=Candida tenuis (strain ATCC 10573 / BCRC 21748 / CBS 615 / JCM 9827 / NBRC 10315 / NRRL Y-1498 / VKM Y-70) TaxID=590646 RepID=G3B3D7_CANTC|nr:ssDNA-binding transcriptional regulator [Yamadazyma tenuis ATCC 10573]XP_006686694.1 uncharacterized protein CANTEDRAFT_114169 [Yamadazyma tenuis ATCC 10573]EGV64379.1 ssDNA-binding transcriptional regulator [Yamadazyma tenuis ATCC 10573]EGV64380.1 hypothetical protein CANTEDRAFT_114169 [Yamadazyma tenuis ATCC 10573]WEJ96218.1 hypothetical protein PSN45_003754 [Yamadazyma tenuis]